MNSLVIFSFFFFFTWLLFKYCSFQLRWWVLWSLTNGCKGNIRFRHKMLPVFNCTQRAGLCAGWELEFRLPVTAAQFIIKSSLFVQSLGVIRLLEPKLGFANSWWLVRQAQLAQNPMLPAVFFVKRLYEFKTMSGRFRFNNYFKVLITVKV